MPYQPRYISQENMKPLTAKKTSLLSL